MGETHVVAHGETMESLTLSTRQAWREYKLCHEWNSLSVLIDVTQKFDEIKIEDMKKLCCLLLN